MKKNVSGYDSFKKYQVTDVQTVEEFLKKYTKYKAHEGRGDEYVKVRIASFKEELEKYGYCFITHHDSITGECVSFYKA
jgi:hypothetical protein